MVDREVALDHKCDTLVESSIVHLLFVGRVGPSYYRKHTMPVFSILISPEFNNRRHSLPKSELESLSSHLSLLLILSLVATPG